MFESQARIQTRIRAHGFVPCAFDLRVGVFISNEPPIPQNYPHEAVVAGGGRWTLAENKRTEKLKD